MYKQAPDTQQAFDCRATAALLRSLGPLMWASQAGAILAASYRWGWASLLCWAVALYFAVRVHLDAALFELLAQDPAQAPGRLDAWLVSAGLRSSAPSRSIEDRCHGARRLARSFVCACVAQLVLLAIAIAGGNR